MYLVHFNIIATENHAADPVVFLVLRVTETQSSLLCVSFTPHTINHVTLHSDTSGHRMYEGFPPPSNSP